MKKHEILAACYSFPPMASPRAIQVTRSLSGLDADVTVVCGEDSAERLDETIAPGVEKYFKKIIRLPYNRHPLLRKLDYIGYRLHLSWAHVPDSQRNWALKARNELLGLYDRGRIKPALLITFGGPMSDHLIGPVFKERTGVPWIAHLSDPWADNPFRRDNPLSGALNRRLESQVIANADAVVFTSPETIDLVMRKYPDSWREKTFYLPHCYDRSVFGEAAPPEDRYIIRLIGSLYTNRTPAPLYKALERISSESPSLLDGVSVEIIGYMETRLKGIIDSYPAAKRLVKIRGHVTYAESIRLMQTAHCLVALDAPAEISIFFPSKLVDYIGSGRFILAISPRGASERIVRDAGGAVANPSDDEAIHRVLRDILERRPDKLPIQTDRYDKELVCREMMGIIERVMR